MYISIYVIKDNSVSDMLLKPNLPNNIKESKPNHKRISDRFAPSV